MERFPWQRSWLPLVAALGLVAAGWLTALQTTIGASGDPSPDAQPGGMVGPLMDDSGEFAVAWNTWGVVHPPGYPLLGFLANGLVRLFRLLGATPLAAASLVSFAFGLAALTVASRLVSPSGPAQAAAVLLPAFGGLTWLYSVVAESYSFGLLLGFAALLMAVEAGENPRPHAVLLLGLTFGLAVGHHRTLLALTPALALAAWPARRLGMGAWLGAAGLAILSLGVYAYLPLAAALGSPWVYGRSPLTWPGLLDAILAREYTAQIAPPLALLEIGAALAGRVGFLAREMTTPGLILGVTGLALALWQPPTRRRAAILGLGVAGYLLAPVGQYLLIGTHLPVMVASLGLAAAWGLGITAAGQQRPLVGGAVLAISVAVAAYAFVAHRPTVLIYTRDPLGQRLIDAVESIDAANPTVVEAWGPRYYALAYGKYASGELAPITLVDARADLSGLPADPPPTLYATQDFLYVAGPDVWAERLGYPVRLESAGDGIVVLARALPAGPSTGEAAPDPAVIIDSAHAWLDGGDVRVTVAWRAVAAPPVDYRVFVHVSQRERVASAEDILAQGDREHPVYGFYPTSRWAAGERVRDDFRIPVPPGRAPRWVTIGLYTVQADGSFVNHVARSVPIDLNSEGRAAPHRQVRPRPYVPNE